MSKRRHRPILKCDQCGAENTHDVKLLTLCVGCAEPPTANAALLSWRQEVAAIVEKTLTPTADANAALQKIIAHVFRFQSFVECASSDIDAVIEWAEKPPTANAALRKAAQKENDALMVLLAWLEGNIPEAREGDSLNVFKAVDEAGEALHTILAAQ